MKTEEIREAIELSRKSREIVEITTDDVSDVQVAADEIVDSAQLTPGVWDVWPEFGRTSDGWRLRVRIG